MRHIFYLHSNICTIVVYDYIGSLLEQGDEIVILLNRGCYFPYYSSFITTYNLYEIIENQKKLGSLLDISTYNKIKEFKQYYKRMSELSYDISKGTPYYLYVPNYGIDIVPLLESNKNCIGYYFIEEGGMSYGRMDYLQHKYNSLKTCIASFFRKRLLGVNSNFQLKITKKFKGTMALNNYAFEWNKKERKIASIVNYKQTLNAEHYKYNYIILISYYRMEIIDLQLAIEKIVQHVKMLNGDKSTIAVKIHPQVFTYFPEYLSKVNQLIKNKFPFITNLPLEFSVEGCMIANNTSIYSVRDLSSLAIYSIVLTGRPSYWLKENCNNFDLIAVNTLNDFIKNTYNK